MEYGRYWDGREDPSGEHFNYGRSGNLVPYGIVNSRLEEADLYRMAIRQGFTLETRSLDPEMTYPAQVFVRERGSLRRSRRNAVELTMEDTLPGFKYYMDSFGKRSRYGIQLPPPDPTGRAWYAHDPIRIHDRTTGEIHERMGTHKNLTRGRSWMEISWKGKYIDLEDLFNAEMPDAPSQRCSCRKPAKRRSTTKRARR